MKKKIVHFLVTLLLFLPAAIKAQPEGMAVAPVVTSVQAVEQVAQPPHAESWPAASVLPQGGAEIRQPGILSVGKVVSERTPTVLHESPILLPTVDGKEQGTVPALLLQAHPGVAPEPPLVPAALPTAPVVASPQDFGTDSFLVPEPVSHRVTAPPVIAEPVVTEVPQTAPAPVTPAPEPIRPSVEPVPAPEPAQISSNAPEQKWVAPTDKLSEAPVSFGKAEEPEIIQEKQDTSKYAYLGSYLDPWNYGDPGELLEINFENAELSNFIAFIERQLNLKFILDDAIKPLPQGGKSVIGTKILVKTNRPITKKETWNIFLTFLEMAGLAVAPEPGLARTYRIASTALGSPLSVNKASLPTLMMDVDPSLIPDNDMRIHYLKSIENANLNIIKSVVDTMKSATAPNVIVFEDIRAILMTDKGSNIRSMLEIIRELDAAALPEMLTVLRLKRTDASKVRDLYASLVKAEGSSLSDRLLGGRRQQSVSRFANIRMIAEPRTNSLILLGNKDDIKIVEEFIIREIDKELDIPYSPLHIYPLKYVDAETIASLLRDTTQFQAGTEAAIFGGVRDGDQYFKPLTITPEKSGNRLIINADYDDYLKIYEALQLLDVEQMQAAIKVLILNIDLSDNRQFGTQIRDKAQFCDGILQNNGVNYQTSGLAGLNSPVIERTSATDSSGNQVATPGATRLLGNLIALATGNSPGSTVVSLGSDLFGVWGFFKVLQSYSRVGVVANPFLVTSNKYQATVSIGEVRRIQSSTVIAGPDTVQPTFTDIPANLTVTITPQISVDGFITLDVLVQQNNFNSLVPDNGNRTERSVQTSVIVANREVIALGGLITDAIDELETKVPILGDLPIVGWLFKNKAKNVRRSSLVVLISAEIIPPANNKIADCFTELRLRDAEKANCEIQEHYSLRDPVNKLFFNEGFDQGQGAINEFVAKRGRYIDPALRAGGTAGDIVAPGTLVGGTIAQQRAEPPPPVAKKKRRSRKGLNRFLKTPENEGVV
jgi:general secretion pathway protein D